MTVCDCHGTLARSPCKTPRTHTLCNLTGRGYSKLSLTGHEISLGKQANTLPGWSPESTSAHTHARLAVSDTNISPNDPFYHMCPRAVYSKHVFPRLHLTFPYTLLAVQLYNTFAHGQSQIWTAVRWRYTSGVTAPVGLRYRTQDL